jgi:hypothetical protein
MLPLLEDTVPLLLPATLTEPPAIEETVILLGPPPPLLLLLLPLPEASDTV